ncbi:hypothetical protein MYO4S_00007 [Serratia phage 4S]|nr:hypothetical protein MYO4S_00007 [Serratia phage 4S]
MSFEMYDSQIVELIKQRIYASMSYNHIDLDLATAKKHAIRICQGAIDLAEEEIEAEIRQMQERVQTGLGRPMVIEKELQQAIAASNLRKYK